MVQKAKDVVDQIPVHSEAWWELYRSMTFDAWRVLGKIGLLHRVKQWMIGFEKVS